MVFKTPMGKKNVRMRKCSQYYLRHYVNEPERFRKWRKMEKPRYWWSRGYSKENFDTLSAWMIDNDGTKYVQGGVPRHVQIFIRLDYHAWRMA